MNAIIGYGFIGKHLHELVEADIYDLHEKTAYHLDIREDFKLKEYSKIYHLAALTSVPDSILHPLSYWRTNVEGTRNVIHAANGTPIIFTSSCAASDPMSPYALTKRVSESDMLSKGSCARLHNVFGEGGKGFINQAIQLAIKGLPIYIYGDGSQTRDFIYVKDLVSQLRLEEDLYEIGYGHTISVSNVVYNIKAMLNSSSEIINVPARDGDIHTVKTNSTFIPEYGIIRGLERTIEYEKNKNKESKR